MAADFRAIVLTIDAPGTLGRRERDLRTGFTVEAPIPAFETVKQTAERHGLKAAVKTEYTKFYVSRRPREFHDWLVFSAAS